MEIVYNKVVGAEIARMDEEHWAIDVAVALDIPLDRVLVLTGYRDNVANYNSDVIQVGGAETVALLDAVIASLGYAGERRIERVAGKSVIRAAPPGMGDSLDQMPYFYAFGDVAIVIIGDRPFVEEALRSLP